MSASHALTSAATRTPRRGVPTRLLASALALGLGLAGAARAQTNYTPYTITTLAGSAGFSSLTNGTGSAARFTNP